MFYQKNILYQIVRKIIYVYQKGNGPKTDPWGKPALVKVSIYH